jgi:S4 domain protein YaaA
MATFQLTQDFITLGQLLKFTGQVQTGGEAKLFLAEVRILVNGERDDRRGRKLYPGDVVTIPGEEPVIIVAPEQRAP